MGIEIAPLSIIVIAKITKQDHYISKIKTTSK